jgi:ribosome assembly protein RRB1
MSKRPADPSDQELEQLKSGQRPVNDTLPHEAGEFEDEFEDEFESEDEVMEAGVDGRPDEEREAEEREGRPILRIHRLNLWLNVRSSHGH